MSPFFFFTLRAIDFTPGAAGSGNRTVVCLFLYVTEHKCGVLLNLQSHGDDTS